VSEPTNPHESPVSPESAAAAPEDEQPAPEGASTSASSAVVGAGIFLSRIAGLVRERVFAQFFGTSLYADAFRAGLRMPNAIQNLLGEGTLSASFIPVYSELLEEGRKEDAGRLAGAIFALLFTIAGALALLGILLAPLMVSIFLPGFVEERREITITIVRILFPMTGVLVLSAWALGILNSHRKFFIPYVAPVIWNGAMIGTLFYFGVRMEQDGLVIALAWGALAGGALQFLIQLPWVLRLEPNLVATLGRKMTEVGEVVRNAIPAIMGRGVVQVSAYIDMVLASLLAIGGVAAIGYAQTLYMLPVSLFGMSVAAAELPELSRQRRAAAEVLRNRASGALRRMAFYVVASFVVFITLGDVVVAALYQTGEFGRAQTILVAATLAAYAFALMASTATRLYSSTYFALRDTKTPAMFATVRVALAAVLGFTLMVQFEPVDIFGWTIGPGIFGGLAIMDEPDPIFFGAVGLAAGTGIAAWVEWFLLRRVLRGKIGTVGAGAGPLGRMALAALAAAAVAWGVRMLIPVIHPIPYAVVILGAFGLIYVGVAYALGVEEARAWTRRIKSVTARLTR
jgi:putative peptidoglycan lipid II flippase